MSGPADIPVEEVVYGRPDGHELIARLYRPSGTGPFPAAIEVHGGAWSSLDRFADEKLNQALARRGIFVAALEFRQAPRWRYPTSVRDVVAGLDWLRERRADYNLSEVIGFVGNSSGGHQAMLAALLPGEVQFGSPEQPPRNEPVDFVVLLWSVIDPVARYVWGQTVGNRPELSARHLDYWDDVAAMKAASPHYLVADGQHRHLPRVLAVQGSLDENLPQQMLIDFDSVYRSAGGQITTHIVPDRGHNFVIRDFDDPRSQEVVELVAEFIHAGGQADHG